MIYTLLGNPINHGRARVSNRPGGGQQKDDTIKYKRTIEIQHNYLPKMTGILHLDIGFYLPMQKGCIQLHNTYHPQRPSLVSLLEFIDYIARGTIFDNECIVASINAKKFFSTQPRTEFTYTRLERDEEENI